MGYAFALASALASLACHLAFEPAYAIALAEWAWIAVLGAGPMGAAFYLWDRALKQGDPRRIGNLAYLAPLISTLVLAATAGRPLTAAAFAAMALILAGAATGASKPSSP